MLSLVLAVALGQTVEPPAQAWPEADAADTQPAVVPDEHSASRVFLSAGAGLGTLLGTTLVGGGIGLLVGRERCSGFLCISSGAALAGVGVLVGLIVFPNVVYSVNEALGGHGTRGATWLGMLIGMAVSACLVAAVVPTDLSGGAKSGVIVSTSVLLPIFGAALGAELSSVEVTIRPTAVVLPVNGGAMFGIGGRW